MSHHQLYDALKHEAEKVGKKVSVSAVLKKLGLNKSNYYDYLDRVVPEWKVRREELLPKIMDIYEASKQIYGAPKITRELWKQGITVSERLVGIIMRENGIRAHYVKKRTRTTISDRFSQELQNHLDRDFNPSSPNSVWCTDITYIWTKNDEFVYLTCVLDLFGRKVLSWTLSKTMEVQDVLRCLEEAKARRNILEPLVIQSDRGSQFTSKRFEELTEGMTRSYSHKGNPWDNACIESFHALIKREWLSRFAPLDYEEAWQLVFEYIEGFYNTIRSHSFCGYLSPNEFEKNYHTVEPATTTSVLEVLEKNVREKMDYPWYSLKPRYESKKPNQSVGST